LRVVDKICSMGILVVTSVGNNYGDNTIRYSPAISKEVLAVGATKNLTFDPKFNYDIADFSCYWVDNDGKSKPDIIAPGSNILSLKSDIYYKPNVNAECNKKNDYSVSSGTSEASAVVTGIAAIIMQKYPQKTSFEVKQFLERSCTKIPCINEKQGYGFINIKGGQ
ncbi:MAG TPA: S8 family serine peptidase, partial [Clostridia bacterium]